MATMKPKLNIDQDGFVAEPIMDDIPDIQLPDEFSMDEPSNNLQTESLNESIFNSQQYEDDYQKINPPTGNWNKEDRWETFKMSIHENDSQPGDVGLAKGRSYTGRTYYSINGRPVSRTVDKVEHAPMLYFRMSPDKRYHPTKVGEFDFSYKLFIQAQQVYLSIHGESLKSEAQLKHMLEEDSYVLKTGKGDSGLIVYDIMPKRVVK